MYTPLNPTFHYMMWGLQGCTLHGHVDVMAQIQASIWCITGLLTSKGIIYRLVSNLLTNLFYFYNHSKNK